ncbi:hypothetical protein [Pseudogemmobacter sp. W21_MBD1_M6]|uniref:hypothetical protein n=1 Tax=Pseudogemmobacter sp. W21_MBD1_M6 TaxID=3240271 RepID=UPI003F9CB2B9
MHIVTGQGHRHLTVGHSAKVIQFQRAKPADGARVTTQGNRPQARPHPLETLNGKTLAQDRRTELIDGAVFWAKIAAICAATGLLATLANKAIANAAHTTVVIKTGNSSDGIYRAVENQN